MKRQIALLFLLSICCAAAPASETSVLIDRSGSMKAHYAPLEGQSGEQSAPLVKELAAAMVNAASTHARPDIAVFDTSVVPVRGLDDAQNFHVTGKDTLLTAALRGALAGHRHIWLLTDNVQDNGGNEDMSDFYALLHSPQIKDIHIFPVLERSDLTQKQEGVLVYAISTVADNGGYEEEIGEFNKQLANNPRLSQLHVKDLLMKPLGKNAIREIPEHIDGPLQFKEGDALNLHTSVQIVPMYPYLYFEKSPVSAEPAPGSTVGSAFHDAPCLEVEKKNATVSPTEVRTDNVTEYVVTVDYGKVHLKDSLPCIWTAAFVTSHVSQEIDTPLTVRVPKARFQFTPDFIHEFTAENEAQAKAEGKIAGLRQLPGELADEETVIPISVPVVVVIRYPTWPGLLLIAIGLLLIAAVIALIFTVLHLKGRKEAVVVRLEDGTVLAAEIRDGNLRVEGRNIGRIEGARFTPGLSVRLDNGSRVASTTAPIHCTLADGRKVIIEFGVAAPIGKTPRVSGSTPPGNPRPSTAPRRR